MILASHLFVPPVPFRDKNPLWIRSTFGNRKDLASVPEVARWQNRHGRVLMYPEAGVLSASACYQAFSDARLLQLRFTKFSLLAGIFGEKLRLKSLFNSAREHHGKWTIEDPSAERESQKLPRYFLAGKRVNIRAMSKSRISETVVPVFTSRARRFCP